MADSKINVLTGLKTAKVSLVKRGANKKQFAVFKSESQKMDDMQEILAAILEVEAENEGKIGEVFKQKLSEKGMGAVKGALRLLNAYKDELPKDVLGKLAGLAGYGYPAKQEPAKKEEQVTKKKEEEKYGKPMQKAFEGLPDDLRKQLEPIFKAQDEARAQEIAKAEEKAKAAEERAEKIAKALEDERNERELKEWIAKADMELSHFPGANSEELGKTLKTLHDVNPEIAQSQFDRMKQASDTIKKSELIRSAGSGVTGVVAGSAYEKIQQLAKQKISKSADMNMVQAEVEVMKENPDLYSQYLAENPAQTGQRS